LATEKKEDCRKSFENQLCRGKIDERGEEKRNQISARPAKMLLVGATVSVFFNTVH
jgi:hypothetical protein